MKLLKPPILPPPAPRPVAPPRRAPLLDWPLFWLLALVTFTAGLNAWWIANDLRPQGWDESIHLLSALDFAKALRHAPLDFLRALVVKDSYYPPLVPALGGLPMAVSPVAAAATLTMPLWQALLVVATFLAARRRFGAWEGLAAAACIAASPGLLGEAHVFMFDMPLAAMVALSLWLLMESGAFTRRAWTIGLGAACGAAMLVKWSFAIYMAAPLALVWMSSPVEGRRNARWGLLAMALVAGPWYAWNAVPAARDLIFFAFKRGAEEGLPPVLSVAGLTFYLRELPRQGGVVLTVFGLMGVVFMARNRSGRAWLGCALVPVILFTLLHNKKDRYILPALPLFTLLAAAWLASARNPMQKRLLAGAAALGAVFVCVTTQALPWSALPWGAPPVREDWHVEDALRAARAEARARGMALTLAVVPDHQRINNLGAKFALRSIEAREGQAGLVGVGGLYNYPLFCHALLVKDGDQGVAFSNRGQREAITAELADPASAARRLYARRGSWPLPDGGTLALWVRPGPPPAPPQFERLLRARLQDLMSGYLRKAERFSLALDPVKGKARLETVEAGFDRGVVGDFRHKDAGLAVSDARLTLRGVEFDPEALRRGELRLLDVEAVQVKGLTVRQEDLRAFLAGQAPDITDLDVRFEDGMVKASGAWRGVRLEVWAALENRDPRNPNLWLRVARLRAGAVPLPAWMANWALKDFNPLIRVQDAPVSIDFGRLSMQGGALRLQ